MAIVQHELGPMPGVELLTPVFPDRYQHAMVSERTHMGAAEAAWRIHAQGYVKHGFVNKEAVTAEGFLPDDIDKARGPNVDYALGVSPKDVRTGIDTLHDAATMREVHIPEGGSVRDLPGYKLAENELTPLGKAYLEAMSNSRGELKEITALAETRGAGPAAVFEVIRNRMQDAMGKDETWFFVLVSDTHRSLKANWGSRNFISVGGEVGFDDERISSEISLKPLVLRPDEFLENILADLNETDDPKARARLERSLVFFSDGLETNQVSPDVLAARQTIISNRESQRV